MNKNFVHILYHVIVLVLSAAIALSIPDLFNILAEKLLSFWAYIENEKMFLISLEICTATGLIILINSVRHWWQARKLAELAMTAGMVPAVPLKRKLHRKTADPSKTVYGSAGDIMIIGSTGLRTFANPAGELYDVVRNCRKARIMLLNPVGEGAVVRAKSIPDSEITPETIKDQITETIRFLKELKAGQKNIRLKLYPGIPLLKLAILGDHAFLRHYHVGFNVRKMPEFVFKSEGVHGGLYLPLYRYFLSLWNDPGIPEYDLETDELVFRDKAGREKQRDRTRWLGSVRLESKDQNVSKKQLSFQMYTVFTEGQSRQRHLLQSFGNEHSLL